ncbi:alpha-(1,3)-fucosyltransferase fut-6-like [Ruditapes philippinarum]|uniref:alpha-(1,3)-fucosyltransferase fut-6-like n=1 Tax=Ruditapes philippinarum TaxID=129788 RepID=UPI00295BABCF|nr:alpha-(1,3)-fucosyltransferase fut-6-like [Ruditapes philippinarum]
MEPPGNMYWDLNSLNGIFNWTAWYRKDASLWLSYGSRLKLNTSKRHAASRQLSIRNFYKEKTKDFIGMISNCRDQAQRFKLVYKLQKYLNIDMFGRCYEKTCESGMKIENKSCENILKQYKFYLAFENSHCKDYVTEKYWNALKRDQIPIVNWKNIDEDIVIPKSYINVYDFNDVKSFVTYVKAVSSNETLYNSYFQWKLKYKDKGSCISCELCQKLHRNSYQRQVYSDLAGWISDDFCPKLTIVSEKIQIFKQWLWSFGIDMQ